MATWGRFERSPGENGAHIQYIHPHCTHRMQPMDVAVMGPFKSKYSLAKNDWLLTNPRNTITIHDVAELPNIAFVSLAKNDWLLTNPRNTITIHDVAELPNIAFVNSFTIKNITSGFAKTGTWPISRNVFSDEDLEAAFMTDRSFAQNTQTEHIAQNSNGTSTQQPVVNLEEPQVCPPEKVLHINFRTSTVQDLNALDGISLPSSLNLHTDLSTNKNILVLNGKATTKSSSA
ncbi:hypothetical protein QE152_g26419 [Popillia japonica]|uniref:Uncharacterized protein n=1 Tax=Popillia japonica TaxID=7064 RepID=A0AAW1JYE8_POPJA